jgi:N6-L-threonylcarbamoyladenine synthase
LREAFQKACTTQGVTLHLSDPGLCTDNAAMIGFAGLLRLLDGQSDSLETPIDPNLALVSSSASC